jgi:hypothetical protein
VTTEQDVIWAAGFVDGEGSVTIVSRRSNQGPRRTYLLRLTVGQRIRPPLLRLHGLFGGNVSEHALGNSGCYVWTANGHRASEALTAMRPYMSVKTEQADVAVRFQTLLSSRASSRWTPLSPDELEQRETLMLAMRAANHANGSQIHWRHRQTI